ncbi:MAG: hypothetical protein JSV38_05020 [Desulfobacterales bacterium]|nr:MAG: hypothetical protein JSV38_05020 [Desulfobacterales bacterium]
MTTIAQTLLDIEDLQQDIDQHLRRGDLQTSEFIDGMINITQAYHFDLLAHSILAAAKTKLAGTSDVLVLNYYALSDQANIHEEYIRLLNIGGLFTVWSLFEHFIRKTYESMFDGLAIENIKDAYKDILHVKNMDNHAIGRLIGEFNVIRFIRNVLHQGGVYLNPKTRTFVLGEETYTLKKGNPIKPIRLMTVIHVIWRHYVAIALG